MGLDTNKKSIKMKITDIINYHLQGFGFEGTQDLMTSTLHTDKGFGIISGLSALLGGAAIFVETYIGLAPVAYIAFVILLVLEFITGIRASIKAKKKIESRKFGRMIVKIGLYTTILGIVHVLKVNMDSYINIYEWLYYAVFNMVVIQLIISVLENLAKLGFAEGTWIVRVIKGKMGKWFDIDDPEDRD